MAVSFLGADLLTHLPTAALAAILLTVASRLVKVKSMARILRFSRREFAVCTATVLLVVLLGVVQGVIIAALVTLLYRTRREERSRTYRQGMIPKSNHRVPVDAGTPTVQVPGVLVRSVEAPLWYADSDFVVDQLHEAIADDVKHGHHAGRAGRRTARRPRQTQEPPGAAGIRTHPGRSHRGRRGNPARRRTPDEPPGKS